MRKFRQKQKSIYIIARKRTTNRRKLLPPIIRQREENPKPQLESTIKILQKKQILKISERRKAPRGRIPSHRQKARRNFIFKKLQISMERKGFKRNYSQKSLEILERERERDSFLVSERERDGY